VRKDFTDAEAAVDEALRRNARTIVLAGALGGGLDHLFGNLAVLRGAARRGCAARLAAPHLSLAVLAQAGELVVPAAAGTRVSLLALSDAAVVSLRGFDYSLEHGTIVAAGCLGIGNAVLVSPAMVVLHAGELAVIVMSDLGWW
jgi:thiamine pyrophosphokinase